MEQEPVYVLSDKLAKVCESVLAEIYSRRQGESEEYVMQRVWAHNAKVVKSNKWRSKFGWCGVDLLPLITPYGMDLQIRDEINAMSPETRPQHPMLQINRNYGGLEHETKECMIQCQMNETVPVSADMARGISHLGLPLTFMQRRPFGFQPAK